MRSTSLSVCALTAALVAASAGSHAADWMQFGYDPAHTGFNTAETTISSSNVATLTTLYSVQLAASVDSAPVYLSNVETANGTKNLLFALSESGRLMAIDAATGTEVWHASQTGRQPTTASPAIDASRDYVYSYGVDGFVHKYQVADGTEIAGDGWPQLVTNKPDVEKSASGLTIVNAGGTNWLYSVTDGYIGDGGDYQGHMTTINLDTGAQVVFNSLCSNLAVHFVSNGTAGDDDCASRQSGIWGRGGAVYDTGSDRVFISTGNGQFNASSGGFNWGDSVVALAHDGTGSGGGMPVDSYTPTNFQSLQDSDTDLGSISIAVMQAPTGSAVAHVGVQSGKDAKLRVIDLDDMSGQGAPAHVGGELQLTNVPQGGGGMNDQPATWIDASGTPWIFVASRNNGISGLTLGLDGNDTPQLTQVWEKTGSSASTSPIVANGVVYAISRCSGGTCVVARDPATGNALWTSANIGGVHWQSPIVVDGSVYVIDDSRKLWAFSLGTPPPTHTVSPTAGDNGAIDPSTPQTVVDGATTTFTVTPDPHYAIDDVTGCGGSLDGSTYTTGAITDDCTVTATFAIVTHTVTPDAIDPEQGSIDPSTPQTVDDGATVEFTVTAVAPFTIASVTGCDGTLDGDTYTTGAITADCSIHVDFDGSSGPPDPIFSSGFDVTPP